MVPQPQDAKGCDSAYAMAVVSTNALSIELFLYCVTNYKLY